MFKHTESIKLENGAVLDLTSLSVHIADLQNGQSKETTKGVQIAYRIDLSLAGEQTYLNCLYQLTQPFKILLIASLAFQIGVSIFLFILFLYNFYPSTHFLYKAMLILPIFGLLTFMLMKASFDQKVKELTSFIQLELKKQKI
ncbi:MAG: hypothetical protein ACKOWX_05470 [Flavobacteriales bacterium]